MFVGNCSQLGKHGFGSLHKLIILVRTLRFYTDLASQMKLAKLPLIHLGLFVLNLILSDPVRIEPRPLMNL